MFIFSINLHLASMFVPIFIFFFIHGWSYTRERKYNFLYIPSRSRRGCNMIYLFLYFALEFQKLIVKHCLYFVLCCCGCCCCCFFFQRSHFSPGINFALIKFSLERWCQRLFSLICYLLKYSLLSSCFLPMTIYEFLNFLSFFFVEIHSFIHLFLFTQQDFCLCFSYFF